MDPQTDHDHESAALVAVTTRQDAMFETTNLSEDMLATDVAVATDEDREGATMVRD